MKFPGLVAILVGACGSGAPGTASNGGSGNGSAPVAPSGSAVADEPPATATFTEIPDGANCVEQPFELESVVPEASGAAWIDVDGKLALVVVSDSGNRGAYGVIDPETGKTLESGRLPLGGEGEDLEGAAERDGRLFAITSAGWIRSWKRVKASRGTRDADPEGRTTGFELVDAPYPLGPIDLTGKKGAVGDKPPAGDGMVCAASSTNCGRNYEGLCLAPKSAIGSSRCVGFASSKADGHLYCLVEQNGKLVVEREGAIAVSRPGVIADCAFSETGALYAASNLFELGKVYVVSGWQEPANARVRLLGAMGVGFPETIAVRGDIVYRMSDLGDDSSPSAMKKFRCTK